MTARQSKGNAPKACSHPDRFGKACGKCGRCKKRFRQATKAFNLALLRGETPPGVKTGLANPPSVGPIVRAAETCTYAEGCPCPGCTQWAGANRAEAEKQARALEAFRSALGITAGQDDFGGRKTSIDPETGWVYIQNGDDLQVCRPVTSISQLNSKTKAERHEHEKSQDWLDAPAGTRELYASLTDQYRTALASDAAEARIAIAAGKFQAQLEWLCHGNGAPLLVLEEGRYVRLLRDPKSTREVPRYPGCPEDVNPKAGKTFNGLLDVFVQQVRSTPWGSRLTNRQLCRVLNSQDFRELFDLGEYRYVSETALSAVHVKLRKAGTIRIQSQAEHYRRGHRWVLLNAAVYKTHLRLMPDQEAAVEACITAALKPTPEETRERLENRRAA